ncbi:hypothetical protein ACFLR3_02400 [Campylobacterota bacterium]
MKKTVYETILSFLLGVSWAFLVLGAVLTFESFIEFGLMTAVFSTIIFIFIFLFVILTLETMNLYREGHEEKRKQTKLLFDIRESLKKEKMDHEVKESPLGDDD